MNNGLVENIRNAYGSLVSNKLRAGLTTLGIGIGIASVVVLISLGQSVQLYVSNQFLSAGSNLVFILPSAVMNRGATGARPGGGGYGGLSSLTEKDMTLLSNRENMPDLQVAIPLLQLFRRTDYGKNEIRIQITASTAAYFAATNRQIDQGRFFDDQDSVASSRVAVIGPTVVQNLFPPEISPLNETIRIGGVDFKVIGVLASAGTGIGGNQDNVIDIPISTAENHLQSQFNTNGDRVLNGILLQSSSDEGVDPLTQAAKVILRTAHKIKAGSDDDFTVITQKDLIQSFSSVTALLTVFLGVIAGISLIVGGIGVMNIMLVTVTERTREIGLRKAVGARFADVLVQFLTEATVLCFVGCFAGLLTAAALLLVIGKVVPALNPAVSPEAIVLATTVTTFIGIFFGLYPASRAASLSPIKALRFE